jgi:hypothetical protein
LANPLPVPLGGILLWQVAELNPFTQSDLPQGPEGDDDGKRNLKARTSDVFPGTKERLVWH